MKAEYVDLAYLAGFLDGEGCFHITTSSIGVKCTNTNKPNLDWIKNTFGGSVNKHKGTNKQCWVWRIHGKEAIILIEQLLPFLKQKNNQAKLLLDFYRTVGKRGKTLENSVILHRNILRRELIALRTS